MDPQTNPPHTNETVLPNDSPAPQANTIPPNPIQKNNSFSLIIISSLVFVLLLAVLIFFAIKTTSTKTTSHSVVRHQATTYTPVSSVLTPTQEVSSFNSLGTMFGADNARTGLYHGGGVNNPPTLLWSFTTDRSADGNDQASSIPSTPVIAEGKVFFVTIGGDIYAVDEKTGQKMWKTTTDCTINYSTPAYANGKLYIGSDCDGLSAVDATTGKIIWNFNPIKKANNNSLYTDNTFAVNSSPVVVDGIVYAGTQGGVTAIDAVTGKEIWQAKKSGGSTVALSDKMVFANDGLGNLYAIDKATGIQKWTKKIIGTT